MPTGKNKKEIELTKDELGGKIMPELFDLRPKAYAYTTDVDKYNKVKKAKGTKKCVIKRVLKVNDYKNCLLNDKVVLKSQQIFKSERQCIY